VSARAKAPRVRRDVRRDRWRRWAQLYGGGFLSITEQKPCSSGCGIGKPFRVLVLREGATRGARP